MFNFEEELKKLPKNPGVYIMRDKNDAIIYVGKAINLHNRVRSYFRKNIGRGPQIDKMVTLIDRFEYIVTDSELEALVLENNLIKEHSPKYNTLLKDDKTYPYIKVDMREKFPNFYITRKLAKDGCKYFGPFMGGINCRDILDIIQLTFSVRLCHTSTTGKKRECLNYHIGRCLAPCAGRTDEKEYGERVKKALSFLDGNYKDAEEILKVKMLAAAENESFELAIDYKNKLEMLYFERPKWRFYGHIGYSFYRSLCVFLSICL